MSGDIDKALAKLEGTGTKATARPWSIHPNDSHDVRVYYMHHDHRMAFASSAENATFIALARNVWPEILEVLHWARANAEAMECRQDEDCDHCMGLDALAALAAKAGANG